MKIRKDLSKKIKIETSQQILFLKLYQHVIAASHVNAGTRVARIFSLTGTSKNPLNMLQLCELTSGRGQNSRGAGGGDGVPFAIFPQLLGV